MNIDAWFSTPILHYDFTGPHLTDIQTEIESAITQINKHKLEAPWGDTTVSTFRHDVNVNDIKTYNMVNLEQSINRLVAEWCSRLNYLGTVPVLKESWLNFSNKGGFQFDHKHPNFKISGCYYYQTSGDDGTIRFENPNPYALSGGFPFDNINADGVVYKPAVGRILLFPSWLTHRVSINNNSTERISLAFNLL